MNIAQRLQDKGIQEGIQKGMQEGIQKGMQEGIREGKQQGIQEGRRETAQQLLTMQIDVEIILKATGLTHQELLLLAQENTVYSQQ